MVRRRVGGEGAVEGEGGAAGHEDRLGEDGGAHEGFGEDQVGTGGRGFVRFPFVEREGRKELTSKACR